MPTLRGKDMIAGHMQNKTGQDKLACERSRRRELKRLHLSEMLFCILLAALAGVMLYLTFIPLLNFFGDNSRYIILAQSIAEGKGYSELQFPRPVGCTKYPFGFPLLLVPVYLMFGINVTAFKVLVNVLFLLAIFVFYFFIRRETSSSFAKISALLLLFQPLALTFASKVMSEIPYVLISTTAMLLFSLSEEESRLGLHFYLTCIAATYAYFVRTVGVALVLALAVHYLLRKDYGKLAIFVAVFLAFAVPWAVRDALLGGNAYVSEFMKKDLTLYYEGQATLKDFWHRIAINLPYYLRDLPMHFSSNYHDLYGLWVNGRVEALFMASVYLAMASGSIFLIMEKKYLYPAYLLLFFAIVVAWPWQSNRMLLPVTPIVIFLALAGFYFPLRYFVGRRPAFLAVTLVLVFFLLFHAYFLYFGVRGAVRESLDYRYRGKFIYDAQWERYYESIYWVRDNVPKDKVIMSRSAAMTYVLAGNKAVLWPPTRDVGLVKSSLDAADYVIYDSTGPENAAFLLPALKAYSDVYAIAYVTEEPKVFILRKLSPAELFGQRAKQRLAQSPFDLGRLGSEGVLRFDHPMDVEQHIGLAEPALSGENGFSVGGLVFEEGKGAWVAGRSATLVFRFVKPGPLELRLRFLGLGFGSLRNGVRVFLNTRELGVAYPDELGTSEIAFEIPASMNLEGANHLVLKSDFSLPRELSQIGFPCAQASVLLKSIAIVPSGQAASRQPLP